MNAVIIIPTIDPNEKLEELVSALHGRGFGRIVVVDDGSAASCDPLFARLEERGVHVLHHAANLGKGAAIKTGLGAVRTLFPEATHVVTADADGQHLPGDIERVCKAGEGRHGHVVIGTRDLSSAGVPMRSRLGNAFSSAYFKIDTGMTCSDTQTGLRCWPVSLVPFALSVEGTRYEYEMNFLTETVKRGIPLEMVPIRTVYEDGNASSHFSTLRDSVRIYRQLARFALSSLSCSFVDLALFALVTALFNLETAALVTLATVIARMVSGVLNFALNRTWSFSSSRGGQGRMEQQALRYGLLFLAQMTASALFVTVLSALPLPLLGVKVLVDGALFVLSFFLQRNWVFGSGERPRVRVLEGGGYAANAATRPFRAA